MERETLEKLIDEDYSIRQIADKLDCSYTNARYWIVKHGLFTKYKQIPKARPLEELLVVNSDYNRNALKKRLIKENILNNECSICGISEWLSKELSLHLDHINGVNNDNRLENLRLLCPNCHSQTDTYGGRNIKLKPS